MARQGKIARLPHKLREEVNLRLLDGQSGPDILAWLNSQPEARDILRRHFQGADITEQNLSEWRLGGHFDWKERREKLAATKELSSHCYRLAKASGSLTDGAASMLAARFVEALENAGEETDLAALTEAVARLRGLDIQQRKVDLHARRAEQKDRELDLAQEKLEKATVEAFLKFARTSEVQTILTSGKPRTVQTAELRRIIFGERPS